LLAALPRGSITKGLDQSTMHFFLSARSTNACTKNRKPKANLAWVTQAKGPYGNASSSLAAYECSTVGFIASPALPSMSSRCASLP
jgi:hypothetical protein